MLSPGHEMQVLAHGDAAMHQAARAACSSWRAIVDASMWHRVRGDLRNPDLGPLPKACLASQRLRRVELSFNSSFTVVSELDNDADMAAFVKAMVGKGRLSCSDGAGVCKFSSRKPLGPLMCTLILCGQARIKLHEYGRRRHKETQRPVSDEPVLVLRFGNFFVHARTVRIWYRAVRQHPTPSTQHVQRYHQ